MATTKPDLKVTRDRLHALAVYLYELIARMQAAGATTGVVQLESLQEQAKTLTQSIMDVEGNL